MPPVAVGGSGAPGAAGGASSSTRAVPFSSAKMRRSVTVNPPFFPSWPSPSPLMAEGYATRRRRSLRRGRIVARPAPGALLGAAVDALVGHVLEALHVLLVILAREQPFFDAAVDGALVVETVVLGFRVTAHGVV